MNASWLKPFRWLFKQFLPFGYMRRRFLDLGGLAIDELAPEGLSPEASRRWKLRGWLPFGLVMLYRAVVRGTRLSGRGRRQINVCFITDRGYFLPTCVALESLKFSRTPGTVHFVHILCRDVPVEDCRRLMEFADSGFWVEVRRDSALPLPEDRVNVDRHVTTTALFKFFLPDLFPRLDRILYLDVDVLVQRDIGELWQTEMGDDYLCVVKDTMTILGKDDHLKWLSFPHPVYFNSGVMLVNLRVWRRDGISSRLLDYRVTGRNKFMDQDALNMVCGGKVRLWPLRFNCLNCYFDELPVGRIAAFFGEEFGPTPVDVYKQAVILHLGGVVKPWKAQLPYLTDLYDQHARNVGWRIK